MTGKNGIESFGYECLDKMRGVGKGGGGEIEDGEAKEEEGNLFRQGRE